MRHSKKIAAIAIATAGALGLSGLAFAYWTSDGAGSGSASVAADNVSNVVVNQVSAPSGLVPGGDPQALSGDFANANPGDVYVTSLTAEIELANGDDWSVQSDGTKPPCTAADFEISPLTVSDHLVVGGAMHDGAWSGTIRMKNGAENQDNCKGATPPIQYSAS